MAKEPPNNPSKNPASSESNHSKSANLTSSESNHSKSVNSSNRLFSFLLGLILGMLFFCSGLGFSSIVWLEKRSLERESLAAQHKWQEEKSELLNKIQLMEESERQRLALEEKKKAETLRDRNLKRIAKAFIDWEEVNGDYPNHSFDAAGKPLLSWRVQILPWLGLEELFDQFQLNEPWDSPKNKALLAKMPDVYALDGDPEKAQGMTHYRCFSHSGALLAPRYANAIKVSGMPPVNPKKKSLNPIPKTILSSKQVTDGIANTILCIEASEPVEWTKPDEFLFPLKGKCPPLGIEPNEPIRLISLDGKIHLLPRETPEAFIRAWSTVAGNEKVNWP